MKTTKNKSHHPFWCHIAESVIHAPFQHRSTYVLDLARLNTAIQCMTAEEVDIVSDTLGETPLHFVVRNRLPTSIVRALLDKKANPNPNPNPNATAKRLDPDWPMLSPRGCLFWATHHLNYHVAMLLLRHGAVVGDEVLWNLPPQLRRKLNKDGPIPLRTVWKYHYIGFLEMTCKSHVVLQILVNRVLIELR